MNGNKLMEKYLDIATIISTYSYSKKDLIFYLKLLFRRKEDLRFYLNYLFQQISFKEKSMLDIGGGTGLYSFYGSIRGAKEVVCLEPELEGSTKDTLISFKQLSNSLLLRNVLLLRVTFQDYDPDDKTFDIILLHASINHLDEEACIKLQYDNDAIKRYKSIFKKLSMLASPGAQILITDCSPNNFFASLGITNPFAPTIEWHKHQPPEYWSNMLSNYGFVNPKIRWTSFSFLRRIGRLFLGNRFVSYFLNSSFCLTMEKKALARVI